MSSKLDGRCETDSRNADIISLDWLHSCISPTFSAIYTSPEVAARSNK